MSESVRFEDKVVIVTGAGGDMGLAHALLFARQWGRVMVNEGRAASRVAGVVPTGASTH